MSRPNSSLQRNLTLTEELEKLEQSITLTLQEIDHNFSRAHRIVTSSILPVVEQYAEQSREVWEGSKFWKQFFESSANVSLSGYEEQPPSDSGQNTTLTEDETVTGTHSQLEDESESYATPSSEHLDLRPRDDDPDLSTLSLSPSHSTPRPSSFSRRESHDVISPSPNRDDDEEDSPSTAFLSRIHDAPPTTPRRTPKRGGPEAITPGTSIFPPPSHLRPSTARRTDKQPSNPVLHRVLDKTYRIQATPLAGGRKGYNLDDSPLSSPEPEAPKLHSELFSPEAVRRTAAGRTPKPNRGPRSPPKPGISVLTPARPTATSTIKHGGWDSDEDFQDEGGDSTTAIFGHSPPKTLRFHVPQSKLLKTPAKDASKRIVSELLLTAGGASDFTGESVDLDSPSVVRRSDHLEDETF